MANEVTNTTVANDQEKFIAARLVRRAMKRLVAQSVCRMVKQPKGAGKIAYFVRYDRTNVPVATLTEATPPTANEALNITSYNVTMDQWGDRMTVSDIAQYTTMHDLLSEVSQLLADNAQRVIDREIQNVWLAGTNVQFPNGVTARSSLTSADKLSDTVIHQAVITMIDNGAQPRGGPEVDFLKAGDGAASRLGKDHYVAICGPQVMHEIQLSSTSFGTFAAVSTYANASALYNGEIGEWLGVRWVLTNFIPKLTLHGNTTTAVADGATIGTSLMQVDVVSGSLGNATFYYKVTRKDLTRGFEEAISIEHTTATGASSKGLKFTAPSTSGYVYNVYFGSSSGDSNLFLAIENLAASANSTVSSVPSSGANPPVNAPSGVTVHPIFIHALDSCFWVGLQDLRTYVTKGNDKTDPLDQYTIVGYKFMGKAILTDQTKLLRVECASSFS